MVLEGDLHTHTLASGHAYSTIKEMAAAAAVQGLKVLAITDHGVNLPGGPHVYHFSNMKVVPAVIDGVRILRGVEANIIDHRGSLDMPESILEKLDWVLAGFHDRTGYVKNSVEDNTRAMIGALYNPYVHAIVHPGNPAYPVDIERVVLAARAADKIVEINNSSLSVSRKGSNERCLCFARSIRQHGARAMVSSDAHIDADVGRFEHALETITRAGLSPDQLFNASQERIMAFLAKHREHQQTPKAAAPVRVTSDRG